MRIAHLRRVSRREGILHSIARVHRIMTGHAFETPSGNPKVYKPASAFYVIYVFYVVQKNLLYRVMTGQAFETPYRNPTLQTRAEAVKQRPLKISPPVVVTGRDLSLQSKHHTETPHTPNSPKP